MVITSWNSEQMTWQPDMAGAPLLPYAEALRLALAERNRGGGLGELPVRLQTPVTGKWVDWQWGAEMAGALRTLAFRYVNHLTLGSDYTGTQTGGFLGFPQWSLSNLAAEVGIDEADLFPYPTNRPLRAWWLYAMYRMIDLLRWRRLDFSAFEPVDRAWRYAEGSGATQADAIADAKAIWPTVPWEAPPAPSYSDTFSAYWFVGVGQLGMYRYRCRAQLAGLIPEFGGQLDVYAWAHRPADGDDDPYSGQGTGLVEGWNRVEQAVVSGVSSYTTTTTIGDVDAALPDDPTDDITQYYGMTNQARTDLGQFWMAAVHKIDSSFAFTIGGPLT